MSFEYHESLMNLQPFIFHLDKIENAKKCTDETVSHISSDNPETLCTPTSGSFNWHSNIEILYFTQGSGYVHCEGDKTEVKKGDIFVVNSNMPHAFSTDSSVAYYCLIPDGDFCLANGINSAGIQFSSHITDDPVLSNMFEKFTDIFYSSEVYRDAMLRALLLNMLIHLATGYGAPKQQYDASANITRGIQSAIGYIKCHLSEKITVEKLANSVNISKYHFLRNFKKLTGDTPIVYVNKLRCENAKKLLSSGSYPIGEVCEKCGFENMSYFAKVFKNYTGKTPSDFSLK